MRLLRFHELPVSPWRNGGGVTRAARPVAPLDEYFYRRLSGAYQTIAHSAPKAAAIRHEVQRLKNTGLAGPIFASDDIQTRLRLQADLLEATEVMDVQTSDVHG